MYVECPLAMKFITSGRHGDWPEMTKFSKKGVPSVHMGVSLSQFVKTYVLYKPIVDNGGVSRGRSVAAVVGYWLSALQWHNIFTIGSEPQHKRKK